MRRPHLAFVLGAAATLVFACFPSFEHLDDGVEDVGLPGRDSAADDGVIPPADGDVPDASADGSGDGSDATTPPALPVSCKDAHDRGFATMDGDVQIDPDATGPLKPFVVFCRDITTATPREFLTLVNTTDPNGANAFTAGTNISGWAMGPGGGSTSCLCPPDVVRAFTRVRLKVGATVKIDVTDHTYSTTNRANDQPNACELAKPSSCMALGATASRFGTAACCIEGAGALGRANVDLRGTVFHIGSLETGRTEGFAASGTTTYTGDRKQADVHGGGACGFQLAGKSGSEIVLEQDP